MSFVAEPVRAPLHDCKIFLVSRERLEPLGQFEIGSDLFDVRKPCFLRDAKPNSEKDRAFGRLCGGFICGRPSSVLIGAFLTSSFLARRSVRLRSLRLPYPEAGEITGYVVAVEATAIHEPIGSHQQGLACVLH